MSKLFDTLEKINRNESAPDSEHSAEMRIASSKRRWPLYLLGLVISGLFLFLGINFFHFQQHETITTNFKTQNLVGQDKGKDPEQVSEVESSPQKNKLPDALSAPVGDKNDVEHFVALNNKGVALVSRDQYWQGIYYLEKAGKLQPERIEPLINLAVALFELHLYGPARRYFDEALKVDSNNPLLRENIDIAAGLGLLKE